MNTTEQDNDSTKNLDQLRALDIVTLINKEDQKVAAAVQKVLPKIAEVVEIIAEQVKTGGRLIYVGCGTSGRLGVLDASECAVTFGVPADTVIGVIAGGVDALTRSMESVEDNQQQGVTQMQRLKLTNRDIVIGITSSGGTPFVLGAVTHANTIGCVTVGINCNAVCALNDIVQHAIPVVVGAEVLPGSTRMKAGTAQKMVLNMLSTASMVRMGQVYGNLMVGMHAGACDKLKERGARIVTKIVGCSLEIARETLQRTNFDLKLAVVMLKLDLGTDEARALLQANRTLKDVIG